VALPYAVGNTIFGGTAEYVALWFKQAGMESGFYWYLSAVIGMAAIGFLMLPETKTESRILED
jgi:MHS family alpha-ketoglutarate permease-like MFS transporter